jgi:hypothetical protein
MAAITGAVDFGLALSLIPLIAGMYDYDDGIPNIYIMLTLLANIRRQV